MIAEQQETDDGKKKLIIDSGAHLTHTATPHANMHKSTGHKQKRPTCNPKKSRTAVPSTSRRRVRQYSSQRYTHRESEKTYCLYMTSPHMEMSPSREPTPTYTNTHRSHEAKLTAKYRNGQYQTETKPTAQGARTHTRKPASAIKKQVHHICATRKKGAIKKNKHHIRATRLPPHIQPRITTRDGIPLAARNKKPTLCNTQGPRHHKHKQRAAQQGCNKRSTPYLDGLSTDQPTESDDERTDISATYGKAVGEIRYIADSTRPDVSFAATTLARALKKPTQRYWRILQRLTQYLNTTHEEVILMPRSAQQRIHIKAYSDADYADDQTTRKSITGMVTMVNGRQYSG